MKKKKLLYMIFTSAPSAIVRAEVFKKLLLEKGYEVSYYYDYSKIISRLSDKLSGDRIFYPVYAMLKLLSIVVKKIKRKSILLELGGYNGILIIKNIDIPFLYKIKKKSKGKILYDHDDAVWLPAFIGMNIYRDILQIVDYVSCDNSYLRDKALAWNKHSFILNGPAQIEIFNEHQAVRDQRSNDIVIGWVGSRSTLFYLYSVYEALEIIGKKFPNVRLLILGAGNDLALLPPFENIRVTTIASYNQDIMVRTLKQIDMGIYPLFSNELSLGRGSLKATIYMAANIACVCAKLGENMAIIEDGYNGMLASGTEEWVEKLTQLIENPALRSEIAKSGREFVMKKYTLDACYHQLSTEYLSQL